MLKTVSSIANAIGALNYKGAWNASTNSPALASGVGTKGDYYVVSVAGATALDGISNWGIGDWAAFNGSAWQRIEGGADLNGVNLSVSGTSTLSGLTVSTALALDASKNIISVTNTGTGNNALATEPTFLGDVNISTGNIIIGTDGKGIDFSVTPGAGTSELLDDYEEGTWTPTGIGVVFSSATGKYTKIGRCVNIQFSVTWPATGAGNVAGISNFPFVGEGSSYAFTVGRSTYASALNLSMPGYLGTLSGLSIYAAAGGAAVTDAALSTVVMSGSGSYFV